MAGKLTGSGTPRASGQARPAAPCRRTTASASAVAPRTPSPKRASGRGQEVGPKTKTSRRSGKIESQLRTAEETNHQHRGCNQEVLVTQSVEISQSGWPIASGHLQGMQRQKDAEGHQQRGEPPEQPVCIAQSIGRQHFQVDHAEKKHAIEHAELESSCVASCLNQVRDLARDGPCPARRRAARRSLRAWAAPSVCAGARWSRRPPLCRGEESRRASRRAPQFRVRAS